MNILFDIGHPAHVHLFRNFMMYLRENGHNVTITTRAKDITNQLLDHYGLNYLCLSAPQKKLSGMFLELAKRDYEILKLHRRRKFELAFGTSVSIAHLSALSRVRSFNFNEDDDDVVPFYTKITYPFATKIVNPTCINYKKWRNKRIFYNSYHELAYLHPNNFTPDKGVLAKYHLQENQYVVVRFSALIAHHDINARGIPKELWEQIQQVLLNHQITIITSIENDKTHQIAPWDMHHVLAFAKMLISDSQTMTIEAAVLGIPSIRINTFIGKSTVIAELENIYHLSYGFLPVQEYVILKTVEEILHNSVSDDTWGERRERLLRDKIDFTQWIITFFQSLQYV